MTIPSVTKLLSKLTSSNISYDDKRKIDTFSELFKTMSKSKKLKRFISKFEKDLENDGLPDNAIQPKLELKSNEYMKLYMQKQGCHEDREKASWISQNLGNILFQ